MTLRGLLDLLDESAYGGLVERLAQPGQVRQAVPDYARAYLLAWLAARLGRPMLVVTGKPEDAGRLADGLETFLGTHSPDGTGGTGPRVLHCPEYDALPYERLDVDEGTTHARLRAMRGLLQSGEARQATVVIASLAAAAQKTLAPQRFAAAQETVSVGQTLATQPLLARWAAMGYHAERAVEVPGTFSLRGGILDVFSPDSPLPARIELLGNVAESIRFFDPASQRSVKSADAITVIPAGEVLSALADREHIRARLARLNPGGCKEDVWERTQTEGATLLEGGMVDQALFYAGIVNRACLLDYLPPGGLLVFDEPLTVETVAQEQERRVKELYGTKRQRGDLPEGFPPPAASWEEMKPRLAAAGLVMEWLGGEAKVSQEAGVAPAPSHWGRLEAFAASVKRQVGEGRRVVIVSHYAQRFQEVLQGQQLGVAHVQEVARPPSPGSALVVQGALASGLTLPLLSGDLVLLTDAEVLGQMKRQRTVRRAVRREAFLSELVPGTYVVHVDHGIGRFVGARRVPAVHGEREYLVLEYAEGDQLFVPSDALDRLSPYVAPGDGAPTLTRLGTQEWTRAKQRAKSAATAMAKELLDLYAAREVLHRAPASPDTPWQQQLEDAFPYVETPDQAVAITEVKTDLEKERPMDRLVCGDVGYGKTEVALRAAFKVVQEGRQAALLCPTTVLAQQHYASFSQRLSPFPVTLGVLHRFCTSEEQERVIEGLKNGQVDIVIGTHRLLQKDVAFKQLGLAIVDDEQRFGVAHKEHLKRLRREVDVLTLSATPIPRTLYMALAGVRDMSTIETPPEARVPVRTFVSTFNDDLVKEAILRELDRGGQVFFVHNRVKDLYRWADKVQALVPQARVVVGHGQMREGELSAAMGAFTQGEADVLVCTTIIEAGLDIPNANTLLVNRPELLGLAQMYQLRGRVGRGAHQAYAYFLLSPGRRLTDEAQRRLKVILTHQELGSGFRIAMQDLEIRGAGNILGAEQSGQIHAVGFDLYVRLLEEAVKELKEGAGVTEEQPPPSPFVLPASDVTVDLPLPAFIPEAYISDLPQRLAVYQRLARVRSAEELVPLREELRDRFGTSPEAVQNLLSVVRVKMLAAKAGMESVTRQGGQIVLQFRGEVGGAREALQRELRGVAIVGSTQLRVELHGKWLDAVTRVLERTVAFEESFVKGVVTGGQA
ncbi:MAG: transcription-repair coupling factor [Dehalococcoidia bacterium]|nr:transcription-repair coupling factor [Dehalococcoidia bacterium]